MVLIYSEKRSSRLDYICRQLFRHVLGYEYRITEHESDLLSHKGPAICYSESGKGDAIHIVPSHLLFEESVRPQDITVSEWQGLPIFFQTQGSDLPFDIFAASFYLITRYEEYLDNAPDKHGRFKAENSLAYRNGFLERPIVDEWAMVLRGLIQERYRVTPEYEPSFVFFPTIDVDHAFAFLHKGPFVNGYKLLKALFAGNFGFVRYALSVLFRWRKDPFFNFEKLRKIHTLAGPDSFIFFHCGGRGKFDKRTFVPSLRYFWAKRKLSRFMQAGLHPSYRAADSAWLFSLEKKVMELAVGRKVTSCRFHYLKFTLPDSYVQLAHRGFTDDWSMIYSNDPGFRAGTSFPFHFYNLCNEKTYKLLIHPTAVMDKTLMSNKGMNPQEAYAFILQLAEKVRAVNGNFVTLFHNDHLTDAFPEWRGWKSIYVKLVQELTQSH